jgi:hypothetical protein
MGACQARYCGALLAARLDPHGRADPPGFAPRPPFKPVPISALAGMAPDHSRTPDACSLEEQ